MEGKVVAELHNEKSLSMLSDGNRLGEKEGGSPQVPGLPAKSPANGVARDGVIVT